MYLRGFGRGARGRARSAAPSGQWPGALTRRSLRSSPAGALLAIRTAFRSAVRAVRWVGAQNQTEERTGVVEGQRGVGRGGAWLFAGRFRCAALWSTHPAAAAAVAALPATSAPTRSEGGYSRRGGGGAWGASFGSSGAAVGASRSEARCA